MKNFIVAAGALTHLIAGQTFEFDPNFSAGDQIGNDDDSVVASSTGNKAVV